MRSGRDCSDVRFTPREAKACSAAASMPGLCGSQIRSEVLRRTGSAPGAGEGSGLAREGQEARLVGRIVLDAIGQRGQPVGPAGAERRDGGLVPALLARHDLRAAGRVPLADELRLRQVAVEPDAALAERDRMRKHATDARKLRSRQGEQTMEDRKQDLVGQMQGAVSERLVQQVVRGRHGAEKRILDREASRVGAPFPHGGDHLLHVAARDDVAVLPAPPRRRLGKRTVGTLNRDSHGFLQKEKGPAVSAGPSNVPCSVVLDV